MTEFTNTIPINGPPRPLHRGGADRGGVSNVCLVPAVVGRRPGPSDVEGLRFPRSAGPASQRDRRGARPASPVRRPLDPAPDHARSARGRRRPRRHRRAAARRRRRRIHRSDDRRRTSATPCAAASWPRPPRSDALAAWWNGRARRLAAARRREFASKWRFNRALRSLVASPAGVRAAAAGARIAPGIVRRMIVRAGDIQAA